jgi:hypothetical protein
MSNATGRGRRCHTEVPKEVTPNTPLRLSIAAILAYPDGSMSASGLRREAAKGRLIVERTAGKDYTTLANIDRMRELCRVETKGLASGSGAGQDGQQLGSSSTTDGKYAQARAKAISARLRTL